MSRDPYFTAAIVDAGKPWVVRVGESAQSRQRFRTRTWTIAILLAAVWLGVLIDPQIRLLTAFLLGGIGAALAMIVVAMGLGLLGFGLFAAAGRLLSVIRGASRWPDESE